MGEANEHIDPSFQQSVEEAKPKKYEEWDEDGFKISDWERPNLADESEPLEGHKIVDFLNLSETERAQLKEKIAANSGVVTFFVHPFSEYGSASQYYKNNEESSEKLKRIYDRLRDLMTIPDEERSPLFIMEERDQIHALHHITKGINRGKIYVVPTCKEDPEPKLSDNYRIGHRENNDTDFLTSTGWNRMMEILKELGISTVILNGLYLSVGSDREYSSGQKIGMSRCVGIVMRALTVYKLGSPKIGEFTYPDGHEALRRSGLEHFIAEPESRSFKEVYVDKKHEE